MKAASFPAMTDPVEYREQRVNTESIARMVVHEAFILHRQFGPGLLEGAYETLLEIRLLGKGLQVERQRHFDIDFEGVVVPDAYRVDLLVEQRLVLDLKAVEKLAPVHFRQVLTYLKVLNLPLGLLINFGAATFKEGIHRVANDYYAFDARHGGKGDLTRRHKTEKAQ
jgi:GxxExxY protein